MKRVNTNSLPIITMKSGGTSSLRADISAIKGKRPHEKAHEKLTDFVDDLNDHLKWLLNRKQFLLQGRHYQVLQQLAETKKALAVYEKGIKNLERQIEEDPKIRTMKSHIKFYEEFSSILVTLCAGVEEEIHTERTRIAEDKKILSEKKKSLSTKNHENIHLASQITKLRDILDGLGGERSQEKPLQIEYSKDDSQKIFPTGRHFQQSSLLSGSGDNQEVSISKEQKSNFLNFSHQKEEHPESNPEVVNSAENRERSSVGANPYQDYLMLKRTTEVLVRKNMALKKNIILKISNFNEAYEIFMTAFHKYEDILYKSQMVVHNQGLNGSLIFLLLNSKKKSLESMNPVTQKDARFVLGKKTNSVNHFRKQQDGEVIDVIYSTFKKMLSQEEKKSDKVKDMVSSVQYDQLMAFTPMQVMGLILLKPEVLRDVIVEFDEKKKRLMTISISLKNVKISDMK